MANKLGNQLLTRVQNEMARNIADIKRQLSEWLERPESGGIETLRKSMAEISGGLSLMEQNEAVELADAIITGIEGLDPNVNENGVTDVFAEQGAEIASGLLILADYIERLGHSSSSHKESVVQAATAIRTMLGNGEKIRVVAQPFISQDTYQALATEVNKIIEAARNQLEQHVRSPNSVFNAEAIINANHDLISLFQILNLQTPQSLLKQINQMLLTPLSEKQWIEVAEAMILVQETLKQLQENVVAEQVDDYQDAVHAQITHSRQLEIDKLINDTGKQGKTFFESLRKQVLQDETVKQKQPWLDAVKQLANYSAITALVNIRELANQLQQLALLFAEFTVQNDETISKTYVPVIDALVAVEYLFDDLAEVGKISLQDVSFLAEAVQNIEKICPASARAKSLFIESANMTPSAAEDDAENTGDMQHFKDALGAGLDVLNDDFSTLEAENAEHEEEEPQEEENPPEQKYEAVLQTSASSAHAQDTSDATVIYAGAAVAPHTDTPPAAAHMPAAAAEVDAATDSLTLTAPAKADEAAHEDSTTLGAASGQSQASTEGKGSGAAYFANKTLRDLDKLEIPAEKEAFIASHSDAVVDEEIREFFSEELGEILALMNDTYPKWREDSADTQLTGDIRRAFHTLKGSGRTVGYEALGEFAWQHEQLLNRVIEKDFSANSLVCDTVGDAISLLNILQQQDEFVEHKGALLQQALVAERVRLSLMDAPQSGQDALDALSRKLRLTDTEATAAPVATTSTTTAVTSSADEDDWSLLDDIVLKDEPTDDNGTTDTASTDSGAVAVSTDTAAPASHIAAQKTASDDTTTATGESATIALADDSSAASDDSIVASLGATTTTDTSTTISLADDSGAATGESIAVSTDTTAATDASATIALADDSSASTDTTDASATISLADNSSATADNSIAASTGTTTATDASATISLADDSSAATGDSIAAAHTTAATTATVADFSGEENYNKALRTLQRGLSMGEPDADMQAALAETIRRQWQQSVADDPALREAMAQSLLASFQSEGGAQQAQWVADILAQANAAGGAAVPVQPGLNAPAATDAPQHETPHGISEQAYNRMLNTLRRGLAAGADEDMQAVLSDSISRQWLQQGIATEGETRDDIIAHLKTALASEGAVDEATLDAMLAQVPHRVPSVLPEGVQQDSYGVMMETLRAGLDNASSADIQETLATAIGNQWQSQNSLQDSAVRAAVAEQMAAVLGGDGHENAALVEAVLNRAAEKARETPAGLNPADYEHLLETLRSRMGEAQNSDAQEAIAASISSQLQSDNQLQDEATRDAIAQRVIAALGGQGETDAAAVEAILERVAVKVADQQPAALPAGVRPEAYGAMLQTLSGNIAAAQSDAAAAEALAASIGAQWQEPHSLQDAATRAAVAQQISAALGGEADAATVEGVLNRAAAQASALPQGVKQEAYGEMLQTLRAGISAAQSDEAAAEALAASIGAQWQEQHSLQDAATRAAVAQQISAALGNEADAATVEGVLNRAAAQAAGLPAGVKQEAYGEMLQTLRAGISAAQSDATAAEALAATIGAQWQEPHSLQDAATRAAVAQQISAALGNEADAATVEGVLNRAAAQAAGLPAGVKQEAYGEMLQTLRAGIGAAQSDAAAAEALAATIGAQWQEQHSLQDAATRAAVAQQISAALGGEADAATVEGVLNRAAAQAAGLPAGVKQEAYGEMLQTLRGNIAAAQSDAAAAEALAASIGAQWQEPHSLQDAATRAAVAQQISVALGGEADTATIESVLNRAAAQAAGLPAGVKQEAYGEMLQTLRGNIAAAQSDAAAAEALAASIGAQWQEPHSLQDATTRAAVAQQISAALGGEADAATVEGVLNRAAAQAAGLPAGVKQEAYGEMLQTLRAGISAAQSDAAAAEALAAAIGAQWQEPHSLQDAATRAAVAQQISAALGNEADVATVEGVLNRAAAQAVGLPQGVKHDAYSEMLQTMRSEFAAAQGDEAATEALATMLAAQWEEPHSLQDPAARAVVAAKISAALGGEVDAAAVEDVLARAAVQAAALPEGVKHEAYGEMLQTLRAGLTASHGDSAVAQEMLAASIGAQWADAYSLHDDTVRATVAARISEALGDKVDAATVAAILDRAVEKAAASALPKELSPEVYNRLLGTLRRGLQDGDADTQAALAATLQRHWEQNGLPQDPATIAAVQQHLGASLAAQGFASQQVDQVFAEAGLQANAPSVVVQAVLPPDAAQDDATTAPQVVDTGFFEVVGDDDAAAGDSAEGGFIDTATVPGDHPPLNDADIVNVPVAFANRPLSGDVQGGAGQAAANSVSIGDLSSILANMPRRVNPAERLSKELASLAQHPGLDDAVSQDKGSEISAAASRAGFLRAVDQFETLSQLADKTESPELIDDLIDAVYDIEDSIDADTAPQWVWRLLDSIEQLLLTHKHEGTPVSLSCAAVLRQSADLIENYEEEANEDDAIDAINSLLNARRELGGGKIHSAPATMPYSGDTLGSELVEDPNANTMLAETFIDEAMSLFAHSQEEAERWDENRSQLSRLDAIRRDIHTLKGSARMAGYNAIGDLTHGVESLIDGIVSGQVEPSSKATSILVGAMWQGMLMLDSVRDGYLPQTDPYILNNIHSYLNQPLPYPDVAEAAEAARLAQQQEAALEAEMRANAAAATLAEEPVVEELPVETDFDDNIDPVLVDIFTDEAQELLQTTSQLLEDDFSKKEVVEELQRTMHTLKGGARLVGFTAIGDTAHLMESVIDKVPELAEGKVRQAKTLLNFGLDAHYDMLDSVLRHEMPQPALEVNESLKTFADSGVFRPPSQKGGDNSDAAPETAEQTPADEAPQAADDAGGQAQEAGDSSAAPATGAASGGGGDSDASASAGSDSAASSGQATHAESAASATHSDHAAAAASSHGDSAAADKAGAASAAPSDSQHSGAPADKAGDGSAPAAHGDSQHSGAPADKAGDGAAPAAHGDNQHSGAAADKAGEGAAASGHDKDKGFDGKPEGVESVIEYGNDAQPEKKEEKKPEPARDSNISTDNLPRYVRVDAQLLDEMIAMTGETAIMRSRMENVISEAEFSLNELTRVAARIAEQMRRLDSETEAQLLYRREQQGEDDTHFDPLEMDRFTEIQQLSRQISEAIDDLKNLQDTLSQDNIILRNLSTQQGIIQRGIQDHLLTTQLMRFDVHEARLRRLVKQTAKSVGKDVNFVLEGGDVEVERRLLEDILPALEHMIRNSLAHGIEKPEERLAAGKPETGTIKLVVSVHAAELSVDLIDDGQGLNYERIREKAEAKGLLDPERADDEAYLSTLILRSGFSTAESLSQLAGRGVGMDVVNEMVKQRRGQIGVYSLRGKGTQFTLSMPFSMSIAEVLLVEIAGQSFAAPMSSIAAISQVDRDSLQRSFDGEIVYQHYNDQDYRQYILGAYFKPEQYAFAVEEQSAPVLFINAGGEPVAFHVDRIQNRLEIIVKNVNRQVLNIPGISGATILGDGRVVPVLELLDLSRRIANLTPIHDEVAAAAEARIPNVLVVDDSVTMRKVSTRLLERHHYNVATAKDGLDAIEVLATFTPDIILLDIEMPRMDGFEFASHVRSSSAVSDVPIVMITSRTGDKHRERADAIGVQGYLGKPYSEDVLIQTIEHLLQKRGDL